jgi:hypothetical protein
LARPSRPVGEDLPQPPGVLRLGLALDGQRPGRLGLDGAGRQPVGLLAQQDLAGAEGGHEAVPVPLADTGSAGAEGPADGLAVAVQEPLHGQRVEGTFQGG